jgi:hypothetical protein
MARDGQNILMFVSPTPFRAARNRVFVTAWALSRQKDRRGTGRVSMSRPVLRDMFQNHDAAAGAYRHGPRFEGERVRDEKVKTFRS